jgi:hypothetical protein
VGTGNAASLALFGALGFVQCGPPCPYFHEATLELGQGGESDRESGSEGDGEGGAAWCALLKLGGALRTSAYE